MASQGRYHGFLVVDKPAGWTSHDVVGRVRRLVGERRVGHAGTLDPAATGVLPVAVGSATRVIEFVDDASKTYLAEITFGVATDSFDADGHVTAVLDPSNLDHDHVGAVLSGFFGHQQQLPPMYSAVKIGGRRLYEEARQGRTVDRPPRAVVFHRLELLSWEPPTATVLVDCSKGTYIRALAHDVGIAAGACAHLSNLVRLRAGAFSLCQAWSLKELAELNLPEVWPQVAHHPDVVLEAWPALVLNGTGAQDWRQGKPIATVPSGTRCRAYDEDGTWLGVGSGDHKAGSWRPAKVVSPAP